MLQELAPNLWHIQHQFSVLGMPLSSRMTVVRMADGRLWLHSPIPMTLSLATALKDLGEVAYIIAPNKFHHLFIQSSVDAFPRARLYGAPGLAQKRPDLDKMLEIGQRLPADLAEEFACVCIQGIPMGNETAWLHKSTQTLILTDLCQWWQGDLAWNSALYAHLTGVKKKLAVPHTVRLMIRDKAALSASVSQILQWPFARVIMAHNCLIERNAKQQMVQALQPLLIAN